MNGTAEDDITAYVAAVRAALPGLPDATRDELLELLKRQLRQPYGNVRDVFVYDVQGRLVTGARLFDQDGLPIRLGNVHYCDGDNGTDETALADGSYPYCPQDAPFRLPSASAAPSASADPSAGPSASASPGTTASAVLRPPGSPQPVR